MNISNKIKVRRVPQRGVYDQATIYEILDKECVCNIGFVFQGGPVVIPTIYGRKDNHLYIHGATTSRMISHLEFGLELCFTMMRVNGLVLARSAFHHSMNYESVVVFGKGRLVMEDQEKREALKAISDQILKGRWEEARGPNAKELKATSILEITIDEASAKVRTGPPKDDKPDHALDIWAGVIPIKKVYESPIVDSELRAGIPEPGSLKNLV